MALAVVCDRPCALTVQLLEPCMLTAVGEMAVCALWMPLPAGIVVPAGILCRSRHRAGRADLSRSLNCSSQGAPLDSNPLPAALHNDRFVC